MPSSCASVRNRWKSSSVPSSGAIAVWPPSADPIAHGLPGSSGPGSSVLFGPLRSVTPIGWIGGRYTMSKPISATAERRFVAPANPPSLRGNSSYQAPWAASGRSTHTGLVTVVTSASGTPATRSATRSSRPAFSRTCRLQDDRRRPSTAWRTRLRGRAPRSVASDSRMRAPSSSSSSTSSPAAALISTSWRQVANRSRQASITSSWRPISVGLNVPVQRSLTSDRSGADRHFALPTRRQRTRAASRSWPSRKMSAETGTSSPTTALAGHSPEGVVGRTSSMVIRPSTLQGYACVAEPKPASPTRHPGRPGAPGGSADPRGSDYRPARTACTIGATSLSWSHRGRPETIQREPVSSMAPDRIASTRSISPSHMR